MIYIRWALLTSFLTGLVGHHSGPANDLYTTPQLWLSADGSKEIKGVLSGILTERIDVTKSEDGSVISISLDKLSEFNQRQIRALQWGEADQQQFDAIVPMLPTFGSSVESIGPALANLHDSHPQSPLAGLVYAVVLSYSSNRFEQAIKINREVLARIEAQRLVDPGRHAMTYSSALNNMAVLQIKSHQGDSAASAFARVFEMKLPLSDAVLANVSQLLRLADIKDSPLALSTATRRRLRDSWPNKLEIKDQQEQGWHYSLDMDFPLTQASSYAFQNLFPASAGQQLAVAVTGCAVTEKYVLVPSFPFADLQSRSGFGISVHTGKFAGSSAATGRLVRSTSSGSLALVELVDASKGSEPFHPVVFRSHIFSAGDDLALLRYPFASDPLNQKLHFTVGKWNQMLQRDQDLHSANWKVTTGMAGGVVANRSGDPIGISLETSLIHGQANGQFIGAESINTFLKANSIAVTASNSGDPATTAQTGFAATRGATALIVAWHDDDKRTSRFLGDSGTAQTKLEWVDPWCVPCKGRGAFDCTVTGCNKGVIPVKKRTKVGFNPTSKQPVFADVVERKECPTCDGRGILKCPHCVEGRIKK